MSELFYYVKHIIIIDCVFYFILMLSRFLYSPSNKEKIIITLDSFKEIACLIAESNYLNASGRFSLEDTGI